LLAVGVLTRSNVTVEATTMAIAKATADKAKAVRSFGSIARPPGDGPSEGNAEQMIAFLRIAMGAAASGFRVNKNLPGQQE
jgi:hypothetical protein